MLEFNIECGQELEEISKFAEEANRLIREEIKFILILEDKSNMLYCFYKSNHGSNDEYKIGLYNEYSNSADTQLLYNENPKFFINVWDRDAIRFTLTTINYAISQTYVVCFSIGQNETNMPCLKVWVADEDQEDIIRRFASTLGLLI